MSSYGEEPLCCRVGSLENTLEGVPRLELLAPGIQQAPTHPELLRQCHDVLALIQSVHGHLPKGLRKLAHAFLGHLPPPSCVKCANSPCLNLGGQSTAPQPREIWIWVCR